jgi:phytoene dehydrogenase-like protein
VAHVLFPDGEQMRMWLDVDRTCEEIARFSRRDADSYQRVLAEYDAVKGAYAGVRFLAPWASARRSTSAWLRSRAGAGGSGSRP